VGRNSGQKQGEQPQGNWEAVVARCTLCRRAPTDHKQARPPVGTGWITRSAIVAGVLRETAARCQCLHRIILGEGGNTNRIACAQDRWGVEITQAYCDEERWRLIRWLMDHEQLSLVPNEVSTPA